MKVALIGACDRNNYGDLLMPIIFKKQFCQKYPKECEKIVFATYGMTQSNMEKLCSDNTLPLSECYNNCDIAVIVGGEVLVASYKLMYFNLQKNKCKIFCLRCLNKIFPRFIEDYSKKQLKGMENAPWILNKDTLKCQKLIYNTVGGKIINESENKRLLQKADYISIRNKIDYENVKKINKNTYYYPDSMVTISNYFTKDDYKKHISTKIKKLTEKNYFIIQINKRDSKGEIKTISSQIDKICEQYNINCLLLPIGYAQGHEDQIALSKIKRNCKSKNVYLINETNIYETTYILKNAKIYIGTSLHGIVISTSYCIPHIILTNKIKKLRSYMDSWKTSDIEYTPSSNIYNNFKAIYHNYSNEEAKLANRRTTIMKNAEENFDKINKLIIEVYNNE